jgi:hypothetical protein
MQGRIIHECRREAVETEACRSFSQVRTTQAYLQSVEELERENLRRPQQTFMNNPGQSGCRVAPKKMNGLYSITDFEEEQADGHSGIG